MGRAATAQRPRKRRRRCPAPPPAAAGDTDCLSALPDDVLLAIACRLPTREAVQLAVLSRRFSHLPALFNNHDTAPVTEAALPLPRRAARPVVLRRLVVAPDRGVKPRALTPVFDAAAEHGVSEISVRLHSSVFVPTNILTIRSLTVLTLDSCAVPRWASVESASLRTLKLHRVAISRKTIAALLTKLPGLETLEMVFCVGFAGRVELESSTVRNFLFRSALEHRELVLKAPGLRTVTLLTRPKMKVVELDPTPEIKKAYLHIAKPRTNLKFRIRPFLEAATGLTRLTLRGIAVMLLSSQYEEIPKVAVTFEDLRMLSIGLDFSKESELVFLLKLLESCPNLQNLSLSVTAAKENVALPNFADHEERLATIPCLTESLVQVMFFGFKPQRYQKELFIFLLTQVKNLKKVGVEFPKNQEAAVRRILSLKKAPVQRETTQHNQCYIEAEYPSHR